ncbi:TUT7 [Symbiodinium pilosum]|uniref:TUT7 protein n=1 Tax=Symbiodinium pilosum TaxID=2952 RepID=A0A812KUJ7_SYMPI|nr:TUT7 [Symbiodinium pilosum]
MNRCVLALEEVVLRLGPNWRVSPFGSAANGFGTKFSDLDATCYELPPEEGKEPEQPQQPAAEVLSERLAPLLREHPEFTMAQEVLHARVPILKLCFEGKLEVDLSCHNTLPLQNTKLLKACLFMSLHVAFNGHAPPHHESSLQGALFGRGTPMPISLARRAFWG